MEIVLKRGCIFLMDGLLLPPTLRFEGRVYSDKWKHLTRLDSRDVDLRATDCGWNFIYLAEGTKRTGFGFGRAASLWRAATKILIQAGKNAFNAVEITEITARHFLGLHWVGVDAHSRNLQKSHQVKEISARRRDLASGQLVPGAERL